MRISQTVAACAALGLVGMFTAAPAGAATICWAFQDLETEFWVAGHKAVIQSLEEGGHTVIERNANESANKQLEQIRDCIAQGVDGIIFIPQDGQSAVTIVKEAQASDVPVVVFNRPPTDTSRGVVVVADNEKIAEQAVAFMADEARERMAATGKKAVPLIMVGDLGDPNAVGRKAGFYKVIEANPDLFETPIEVATKWDAATALANLEAAITANPDVDFLFTSSDFLFPTIRSVLEPRGMWVKAGDPKHVIMGGLDGDVTACGLIKDGFVDATGVQDLFYEADASVNAILKAIEDGDPTPNEVIEDPGFALTSANLADREMDMWGCALLAEKS